MANKFKFSPVFEQSAVVPFCFQSEQLKIMLITSHNRKRWIIPKGLIDEGHTPIDSAKIEAYEEAGLIGDVYPCPIGEYHYRKWGGTCHVIVFLMKVIEVEDDWLEAEFRRRRWVTQEKAVALVNESGLKKILGEIDLHIEKSQGNELI